MCKAEVCEYVNAAVADSLFQETRLCEKPRQPSPRVGFHIASLAQNCLPFTLCLPRSLAPSWFALMPLLSSSSSQVIKKLGKGAQGAVFLVEDKRGAGKFVMKKVECNDEAEAEKAFKEVGCTCRTQMCIASNEDAGEPVNVVDTAASRASWLLSNASLEHLPSPHPPPSSSGSLGPGPGDAVPPVHLRLPRALCQLGPRRSHHVCLHRHGLLRSRCCKRRVEEQEEGRER